MIGKFDMRHSIFGLALASASMLLAASAQAQTNPAAPPAVRPTDVKAIGDWDVHCRSGAVPPCEMLQVAQSSAGKRVMGIAFAYLPKQNKYLMQITLPLGVSFAKGVKLVASAYTSPAMPYLRCDRAGCYVEGFVDSGAISGLSNSTPQAKMIVASYDDHVISLPLSLNGFSQALTAMSGLARDKMGASSPAPAATAPTTPAPAPAAATP